MELKPLLVTLLGVSLTALPLTITIPKVQRGLAHLPPVAAPKAFNQPGEWDLLRDDTWNIAHASFADGAMTIHLADASQKTQRKTEYRGVMSAKRYDFTGASRQVAINPTKTNFQDGMEVKFHVTKSHFTDFLSMQLGMDGLTMEEGHGGKVWAKTVPLALDQNYRFRIRHSKADDTIHFEVSLDGKDWIEKATRPREFDITSMVTETYAGTWKPVKNPGTVTFYEAK